MRSLAISSQKGGVGKTTLSLNLSFALAHRGWNTLLVDGDPQGSVGLSLQGDVRTATGLVEVLEGQVGLAEAARPTRIPSLKIVPAGAPEPSRSERWAGSLAAGSFPSFLEAAEKEGFDLVVVDTPSGLHGANLEILRAVDAMLVPIQAEPLALRSVTQTLEAVGLLRDGGSEVTIAGFVVTMLNSRHDVSLSVAQEAWGMLPSELVLEAFVPRDDAFLLASAHGVPLGLLSRRPPPVATVFDRLAAEIEPSLGLVEEEAELAPISLMD
ncbi:MAG: ParA family protein [Acidobacteriota bacterium]